ncbi:hypothetical protein B0H12DRAFT_1244528 [Mycena haematopus]|nr:hypothetical protein B0H12DRAFT_1244528 [Mycena haematopus]
MGKCSTSVLVSVPGVKPLNVDTLDAIVDEVTLSWTVESTSPRPRRLELRFATLRQLKSFVFALCFSLGEYLQGGQSCGGRYRRLLPRKLEEIFVQLRSKAQAAQYSFNALPVELIAEIFLFCAPSVCRPDRLSAPLILLQVCSMWRSIAAVTAALWRTPSFSLNRSFIDNQDNHRFQIASWFTRAKSTAIALSLTVEEALSLTHESLAPFLFELVRTLHISSPHSQLYKLFEGSGGSTALESITLTISAPHLEWALHVHLCLSAPLLRNLTIHAERLFISAQLSPTTFVASFPWSQLTVLNLKLFLGTSVWISVFSQCRLLRIAHFVVWDDGSELLYPAAPVALEHLESLRLIFRGGFCETDFFDHFAFAALHTLHITGLMSPHRHTAFMPTLTNLRALFLDVPGLAPSVLQSILGLHPRLEQFSFVMLAPSPYAPVLQQLQHDFRLRSLTISSSWEDDPTAFTTQIAPWAIHQASVFESDFRLFGRAEVLDALKNALTEVGDVEAVEEFTVADPDHPFAIFPYSRTISLVVRRRRHARGPAVLIFLLPRLKRMSIGRREGRARGTGCRFRGPWPLVRRPSSVDTNCPSTDPLHNMYAM